MQQLGAYCITGPGKELALGTLPFLDTGHVRPELQRVNEFLASFNSGNPVPHHGFEPIEKELRLLNIENSTLEISDFRRILSVCLPTKALLLFFKKFETFYVSLASFSAEVAYTSLIVSEVNKTINTHGEVRGTASETLAAIKRRVAVVHGQINSSFAQALSRCAQAGHLDEIRETIVENRRVLAVKGMHRKKIRGTVLGQSKTGSIVYIEPRETLEFTTELSHLLHEESEEVKRILKALTEHIRPYAPLIRSYAGYLAKIDVLYAKAKYALSIGGVMPVLSEQKQFKLINAYHPLLLRANKKRNEPTYPQSIAMAPEKRIIVISGPNAGGKSITLKTVGLLQLMVQSGIPVPVDPQSEFCFFDRVLTDIGDNQSIENQLSTYSYRLKKMNQFLKRCNGETLFLIDEFGTGSDPELGGALAETFLEVFYERGGFGIITTHYTNLKLLANELPHAVNANMQFDSRSLAPLYTLHLGEAGSSFTFEVAQKNGIPYSLVNRAKKKIDRGKVRFDKTIANLQKERSKVRKTAAWLETTEKKAREETKQLEQTNARVQHKLESYQELFDANQRLLRLGQKLDQLAMHYANNKKKKLLMDELFKLVMTENSKRKKPGAKNNKRAKAKTLQVKKEVAQEVAVIRKKKKAEKEKAKKTPPQKPIAALKIGDSVRIIAGRAVGTIDTIENKKAKVNYGMFTADVSVNELEKV